METLPPHSQESEQGYIGCLLHTEMTCDILANNAVKAESFYDLKHVAIYEAITALVSKQVPVEIIALASFLRDSKQLETVGGAAYLSSLMDAAPSPSNHPYFSSVIREKHLARRLLAYHTEKARLVVEVKDDIKSHAAKSQSDLEKIILSADFTTERKAYNSKQLVQVFNDDTERRYDLNGGLAGLSTGITRLNHMTEGYQAGDFVIIGGRPSDGKTAFGVFSVDHICLTNGHPTLIITLEMSPTALMRRLCGLSAMIRLKALKSGEMDQGEFNRFVKFNGLVKEKPLYVEDVRDGVTASQLKGIIRRYVKQYGIKFVLVEGYLQKAKADTANEKRTYELEQVSNALKSAAETSGAVVMVLAQLNRGPDKDGGRPPRISDLGDCKAIEQDADTVILLHRNYSEQDVNGEDAVIILGKQRDGEKGPIKMRFNSSYGKWDQAVQFNPTQK